jgi:flagellar biosynthesis protein FlhF
MNLKTFQARTMADALSQVKTSLGSEAVILHTRTFRRRCWLGLRRQEVVEITAGRGARPIDRTARSLAAAPAGAGRRPSAPEPGRQLLESPAAQNAAMLGLTQEVGALKALVTDLVSHTRQQRSPEVPQELFDHYTQLIEAQVAEDVARQIVKSVQRQLRPEHLSNAPFVRDKLVEQVEKLLPTSGPIKRSKTTGPHVVALIGPTGVGKTTTVAKLAANLKLRDKRRVGLVTIDTYRIAAVDQLRKYADILGSSLMVVSSPEDLKEAIRKMSDCEYILIDTAGRSPTDALKLSELKAFLKAAAPDEVHLVLSTTSSLACVELAISRFSEVRVDKIIFTKIDEAAHLGVVLNVLLKVNKALSYITTGQDVPDDIEVGHGKRLAGLILGGGGAGI